MSIFRTAAILLALGASLPVLSQEAPKIGGVLLRGKTAKAGETLILRGKRFYIFKSELKKEGLEELIKQKITENGFLSKECYYKQIGASPEFLAWLRTSQDRDGCDSILCWKISTNDVRTVREFDTAYKAGLKNYGTRREALALKWLINNMPAAYVTGYNDRQKELARKIAAAATGKDELPRSLAMSDVEVTGLFSVEAGKYLISNLVPVIASGKAYIWSCDATVKENANVNVTTANATNPRCRVSTIELKDETDCPTK